MPRTGRCRSSRRQRSWSGWRADGARRPEGLSPPVTALPAARDSSCSDGAKVRSLWDLEGAWEMPRDRPPAPRVSEQRASIAKMGPRALARSPQGAPQRTGKAGSAWPLGRPCQAGDGGADVIGVALSRPLCRDNRFVAGSPCPYIADESTRDRGGDAGPPCRLLEGGFHEGPQLAGVQALRRHAAQAFEGADADFQVLVDLAAVEGAGHAGQLQLAVRRLVRHSKVP